MNARRVTLKNPILALLELAEEIIGLERRSIPDAEWPGLFDKGSYVVAVTPILDRTKDEREKLRTARKDASEKLTQFETDALDELARYRGADNDFDPEAIREFTRKLMALMNWETTFSEQYRTRDEIAKLMMLASWGDESIDHRSAAGRATETFVEGLSGDLEASTVSTKRQAEALERQRRIATLKQPSDARPPAMSSSFPAELRQEIEADLGGDLEGVGQSDDQPTSPNVEPRAGTENKSNGKKSTSKGEAEAKLIAALNHWHQYEKNGSCMNTEPIKNNELARRAKVAKGSASAFFQKHFKGHVQYRTACLKPQILPSIMRALNGEIRPCHLLGDHADLLHDDKTDSEND